MQLLPVVLVSVIGWSQSRRVQSYIGSRRELLQERRVQDYGRTKTLPGSSLSIGREEARTNFLMLLAYRPASVSLMISRARRNHRLPHQSKRVGDCILGSESKASNVYERLRDGPVLDPMDGSVASPLQGLDGKKALVVVLPQLGEFDSSEFCEQLVAVDKELKRASVELRVIGIGDKLAARRFCSFTGLDLSKLRVDPEARLHRMLGLHEGPGWTTPEFVSDSFLGFLLSTLPGGKPRDEALIRPWFNAWVNYLAMCAGIAAPGTLSEIFRGYLGDKSAPERLASDAIVKAGPIEIGPGVGPVKLGPLKYKNGWAEEAGYQRPVELATVRLRNMVEVLSNWDEYVTDPRHIAMRGATYLFDSDGSLLYEYRHRGVLTYSSTMSRPLTFLTPYIGSQALNPLNLGDASLASIS